MKTLNEKENTKKQLGVIAPAAESQSSRAFKQPLKSRTSNKIKVLLDSGSEETFISYQKEKTNPFPTWLDTHQSLGTCQIEASKQKEEASSGSIFEYSACREYT